MRPWRERAAAIAALAGEANPAAVLDAIRHHGPIARVALAERLGLSPATVTTLTADLIESGLVAETTPAPGAAAGRRGRPPVLLAPDPGAMALLGAKISDRQVTVALTDFTGHARGQAVRPLPPFGSAEAVVDALAEAAEAALAEAGRNAGEVACFGVGMPGFVEYETGRIHWSPAFDAPVEGFAEEVRARLGCPVVLDNDANLATLAELRFGFGRGRSEFLTVTIENGVGLGIVTGGRLFRGARGLGTEFGHTKIRFDGALCRCGQRGCLEAYVADYALIREAAATLSPPLPAGEGPAPQMAALYARADGGDAVARAILARAGAVFGMGLANLVNLLDPPLIILAGERMRFDVLLTADVLDEMERNMIRTDRPAPEIRVHRWGDLLWARGAAVLAMDAVLSPGVPALS